jgi:predicted nucleic-acid-binding Zn-ribbon protein
MSKLPSPPPLSPKLQSPQERISNALEALRKRGVKSDYCLRCETNDWNVDILEIPVRSAMSKAVLMTVLNATSYTPSDFIPVLAIVCKNCGFTMFHNLNVLGISAE